MEDLRYNCSRYFKDYYRSISSNQFKEMKVESLIFITHLEQELIRERKAMLSHCLITIHLNTVI